jgi:antitoxin component of RelBE/YafQ-DinJ toxin-antitoxin module
MEARIQFRVDEEVKRLAQTAAERMGITLSDACRDLAISLAEDQKQTEANNEWLQNEINKAYEKLDAGKAHFHSHENAMNIIELRKKRVKAKNRIKVE